MTRSMTRDELYKHLAEAVGTSAAKLQRELADLGLETVLSEASRLRFGEQFGQGYKGLPDTTPTLEHIKTAFKAICRTPEGVTEA